MEEWKKVVDAVVKTGDDFDPAEHKDAIDKPKHIYQSTDDEYYSSLPKITIHDTESWDSDKFADLQNTDYK